MTDDQEALKSWRDWVPFVWGEGGPWHGTDEELRESICRQFDAIQAERDDAIKAWNRENELRHDAKEALTTLQTAIHTLLKKWTADKNEWLPPSVVAEALIALLPTPPTKETT